MKIKIDYELLHSSISKFKNGEELSEIDRENILLLLVACEGDYYPTREELETQIHRIKTLNQLDQNDPSTHERTLTLINLCTDYENRYL